MLIMMETGLFVWLMLARLQPAEAISSARNILRHCICRLNGGFCFPQVGIIPQPRGLEIYYPFWLVYYLNRKGQMNSKAYDGLTGEKATGNCLSSIRISLLEKQQSILK